MSSVFLFLLSPTQAWNFLTHPFAVLPHYGLDFPTPLTITGLRGAAGGRHPPRRNPHVHVIKYIYVDILYTKYNFPESRTALRFPQVLGLRAREQLVIVLRPFFVYFLNVGLRCSLPIDIQHTPCPC